MTLPIEGILAHYGVEFNPDKAGNQKVLCPFHDDSVASGSVNLGKGLFNCYGCDMSGDGITLVMRNEGLEFVEAQRFAEGLAGESGSEVSRRSDRGSAYLSSSKGARSNRRGWRSPWARRDS